MKKTILWIILAVLFSTAATYSLTRRIAPSTQPAHAEAEHHDADEEGQPEVPGIETVTAISGDSWDTITASGEVAANTDKVVRITPRISGKIVRVHVGVGDAVKQGQVVTTLSSVDISQARASYRQASARVQTAANALNRQIEMANLGAFSKRPVEDARSAYLDAESSLAESRSELAQFRAELTQAESEVSQCETRLRRARELYGDQIISRQDLESAEAELHRDQAALEAAKARVKHAETKVDQSEQRVSISRSSVGREEKMLSGKHLSSREIEAARADLTSAKLDLRAAEDALRVLGASPEGTGDTVSITSPIAGRVVARTGNIGEIADPSTTVLTIMNLSDVWVEADVYEKDLARIRKGQSAEIRLSGFPNKAFFGKVTHIGDVLDHESRTAKIRCTVANSHGTLKPEMSATVNIITAKRHGAVLIPKEAVVDEGGNKVVFVKCMSCEVNEAGEDTCKTDYDKKTVTLGPAHGNRVEVLSGVELGEEVVTVGAYQLKTALGSGKIEAGCPDD